MNVMVAGGAGYIGSHAVKQLIEAGHRVVAVDNLYRGHRQAIDRRAAFHKIDLAETGALAKVLAEHAIDAVVHFAAFKAVGESTAQPLAYYANTTAGTIPLALSDARADGRLKKGDLVLLASVGAGFTVGSVLLRWSL